MKEFPLFVGIDVSKDHLDVAVRPTGEAWQVSYDSRGRPVVPGLDAHQEVGMAD